MLIALVLGSAALWSITSHGASWQTHTLEEIIVTGERDSGYGADSASVLRSNTPLLLWPQSVQVINQTLIDEQVALTVSSALVNVAGVVPSGDQEQVLINPFIRGLEAELYLDGLIGYGDTAVLDPASTATLERIEVAKGPTSSLFGGGTGAPTGGLINLVTKTSHSERQLDLGFTAGRFDHRAFSVDGNLPVSDTLALRLAGEQMSSDDAIDSIGVDRLTLNPSLRWQATDRTEVVLRGFYNRIEQLEYTGLPAAVEGLPGVDAFQLTGAANAPDTEIENQSLHAAIEHQLSDTWSVTGQLRAFKSQFDEYSSFPFLSFFPLNGTTAAIIRGQLPVETDEVTADIALRGQIETGHIIHDLLIGVTYDETDYEAGSGFDFTPIGLLDYASGVNTLDFGPIPAINSRVENAYRTQALYVQDTITLGERLHLLLSGRLTQYELDEIEGGTGADETYTEFDPRLGLTWSLNERWALFAGYATGSRIVPFFTGVNSAAPVPEESRSVEAGIKFDTGSLSGTVAWFDMTRDNIPATDLTDPFFGSVQTGKQSSQGLDVDVIWEPSPSLSLLLSYSLTEAENASDIASFGTVFERGNALARIPRQSGRAAIRHRWLSGPAEGLAFGIGATYRESAPLTDGNAFFSDSVTLYDAQVSYTWARLSLDLSVQNLTDKRYFRPYQYLLQEVGRPGTPRSATLRLGWSL